MHLLTEGKASVRCVLLQNSQVRAAGYLKTFPFCSPRSSFPLVRRAVRACHSLGFPQLLSHHLKTEPRWPAFPVHPGTRQYVSCHVLRGVPADAEQVYGIRAKRVEGGRFTEGRYRFQFTGGRPRKWQSAGCICLSPASRSFPKTYKMVPVFILKIQGNTLNTTLALI